MIEVTVQKKNSSEPTVRARTVKMLIFVILTAILIIGGGVYILFDARVPITQAITSYNQSRDLLAQLRIDIQRLSDQYSMMSHSYSDKQRLPEEISLTTEQIQKCLSRLQSLEQFQLQTGTLAIIESVANQLREVESKRKTEAMNFLHGTLSRTDFETGLKASLKKDGIAVQKVKKAILSFSEQELLARFQRIIFWIIPLTFALFILPLAVVLAVLRRINRDLLGYVWSLYNLSEKNEDSSTRLRMASQNLATTSSQQSAAISQTSSSITQIRDMLLETEKRVREVRDLTNEMDQDARKGQEIMQKLEKSMRSIEETNRQIENFASMLSQIQTKTQVINDIVFKTQLLSFNASIEAARAGQNGRGFSVVATEVGKLAMLSGDAARDIDQLLNQSSTRVSQIVSAVNERAQAGTRVSQDVLIRFSGLTKKLDLVSQKVAQVALATAEQAGGIGETENAMAQVSLGANENKAQAEEVRQVSDLAFQHSQKIREVSIGIRRFVREDRRSLKRQDDTFPEQKDFIQEQEELEQGVSEEKKVLSFSGKTANRDIDLMGFERASMSAVPEDLSADHPTFKKMENK